VTTYFITLARSVGRVARPERRAWGNTLLTFASTLLTALDVGIGIGIIIQAFATLFASLLWTSAWRGFRQPLTVIGSNLENK
jgi:hypothetical protein